MLVLVDPSVPEAALQQLDVCVQARFLLGKGQYSVAEAAGSGHEIAPYLDCFLDQDKRPDVVVLTNASGCTGIPMIMDHFSGEILATAPIIWWGNILLEELANHLNTLGHPAAKYYTEERRKECLRRVRTCTLGQPLFLEPKGSSLRLRVQCMSSGYSLGSCIWNFSQASQQSFPGVSILGRCSKYSGLHPKELDLDTLVKVSNKIWSWKGALTSSGLTNTDAISAISLLCVTTCKDRCGRVIIPILPTGIIFDLVETVCAHLALHGLANVPVLISSGTASEALRLVQIGPEWLSSKRKNAVVAQRESFNFTPSLRATYSVASFDGNGVNSAVVFATHPSLKTGDASILLSLWRDNPDNLILLVDPEYDPDDILAPFLPIQARVKFCPIDVRLSATDLSSLATKAGVEYIVSEEQIVDLSTFQLSMPPVTLSVSQRVVRTLYSGSVVNSKSGSLKVVHAKDGNCVIRIGYRNKGSKLTAHVIINANDQVSIDCSEDALRKMLVNDLSSADFMVSA